MKFTVEKILNLPDMKVLDFPEIEGGEIIITLEKGVNHSICPSCRPLIVYIRITGG